MIETKNEILKHIINVKEKLSIIIKELINRQNSHDKSKLTPPEIESFHKYIPLLKQLQYNSKEYKECLKQMDTALEHHYKFNRHHPEHFTNGIQGMDLVDLVEMFCDWVSSSEKQKNGDIYQSIKISQERFNYSDDLRKIFENTVKLFLSPSQDSEPMCNCPPFCSKCMSFHRHEEHCKLKGDDKV